MKDRAYYTDKLNKLLQDRLRIANTLSNCYEDMKDTKSSILKRELEIKQEFSKKIASGDERYSNESKRKIELANELANDPVMRTYQESLNEDENTIMRVERDNTLAKIAERYLFKQLEIILAEMQYTKEYKDIIDNKDQLEGEYLEESI